MSVDTGHFHEPQWSNPEAQPEAAPLPFALKTALQAVDRAKTAEELAVAITALRSHNREAPIEPRLASMVGSQVAAKANELRAGDVAHALFAELDLEPSVQETANEQREVVDQSDQTPATEQASEIDEAVIRALSDKIRTTQYKVHEIFRGVDLLHGPESALRVDASTLEKIRGRAERDARELTRRTINDSIKALDRLRRAPEALLRSAGARQLLNDMDRLLASAQRDYDWGNQTEQVDRIIERERQTVYELRDKIGQV